MTQEEKDIRNQIASEISYELKIALENCASIGVDGLRPGPNDITSTYVERMHAMIINKIKPKA